MMMKKHHHLQNMPNMAGFPQFQHPNGPQFSHEPHATVPSLDTADADLSVSAKSDAVSDNPYQSIVTRNVFGLNPIPPQVISTAPPGPPPPKITVTGITTIFGPKEALFKVAGVVRGGGPPKDEYYTFTEGEEEDDVEVTKIDTEKNIVSFMNHGVEQDIALVDGTASSGSAPSAPSTPSWPGVGRRPGSRFRGLGGGFQPRPYQPQSYGNPYGSGMNNNTAQNGANLSGMFNNDDPNYSSTAHDLNPAVPPAISQLSDEDQQALIAAQHAQMLQQGDPTAAIMPPTSFDQQAVDEASKSAGSGR